MTLDSNVVSVCAPGGVAGQPDLAGVRLVPAVSLWSLLLLSGLVLPVALLAIRRGR